MKHYTVKHVAIERQELDKTTCDRCGKKIELNYNDTLEFELRFVTGYSYSSDAFGGSGWMVDDLCKECADWLKDLLIKNGVKVVEYDY